MKEVLADVELSFCLFFSTSVSFPHFLQFVSGAADVSLHSLSHLPSLHMCGFTACEKAKTDDELMIILEYKIIVYQIAQCALLR